MAIRNCSYKECPDYFHNGKISGCERTGRIVEHRHPCYSGLPQIEDDSNGNGHTPLRDITDKLPETSS